MGLAEEPVERNSGDKKNSNHDSVFLSEMVCCSPLMQGRQIEQRMKARIMVSSLQLGDDLMTCWQSALVLYMKRRSAGLPE